MLPTGLYINFKQGSEDWWNIEAAKAEWEPERKPAAETKPVAPQSRSRDQLPKEAGTGPCEMGMYGHVLEQRKGAVREYRV